MLSELQKGFTLMELLVVVAIIAVLMGIVSASVTGTKSQSVEGQVKSDGRASQIAVDNFSNKSIKKGQFPEKTPDSSGHIYSDVFAVGSDTGDNVLLRRSSDDKGERLADKITPDGGGTAVFKRRLMDFTAETNTHDSSGAIKTGTFVPDFLLKLPTSLTLKGDETKDLGSTNNTFEEYIWLLLVNAPGQDSESRTIEVYRMVAAYCADSSADPFTPDVEQPATDAELISSGDMQTKIDTAAGCDDTDDTVTGLI